MGDDRSFRRELPSPSGRGQGEGVDETREEPFLFRAQTRAVEEERNRIG